VWASKSVYFQEWPVLFESIQIFLPTLDTDTGIVKIFRKFSFFKSIAMQKDLESKVTSIWDGIKKT